MGRLIWVVTLLTVCTGCANLVHRELADADDESTTAATPQLQLERERADHYIALLHKRKQDFEERQAYYEYVRSRSRRDPSELASNAVPNSVCAAIAEGQVGKTAMAGTAFRDYEQFRAVVEHCRGLNNQP